MAPVVSDDEYGNFPLYLYFKTITFPPFSQHGRYLLRTCPLPPPLSLSLSFFSVKATEYDTEWRNHYCMSSLNLLIKDDLAGHGLINFKNTKTKCRICWCLIEFRDWRYSQSCWYFRPSFVNYCPSTFSMVHLPHPFPPSQIKSTDTDSVWLGRGGGMLSCVGVLETIFCRSLTLCFWPESICFTTPNKNLGGEKASDR